jgi:ATP-dependent exoDNAse (exonuclease V) alpha subunit
VLVGDWAQLGAIDAGGAFHLLATTSPDTPELSTVRRFREEWEADASTRLRAGDPTVIDTYLEHDRIHSGDRTDMLHTLFDAWQHDTDHGHTSAMIAPDDASVRQLNALAQAHRHDTGQAQPGVFRAADGHLVGVGDLIVTRRNDRRLRTPNGWVKNGDTWTVQATNPAAITAVNDTGETVALPRDYVEAHVQLGYATTVHRSQGSTVDTAHALVTGTATREALYVATTRARTANHLYVDTNSDPDIDTRHETPPTSAAREALATVLTRSAAETSAHARTTATESQPSPASPTRTSGANVIPWPPPPELHPNP